MPPITSGQDDNKIKGYIFPTFKIQKAYLSVKLGQFILLAKIVFLL